MPTQARLTRPYWKRLPDAARYEFEPDAPFGLPFRPTPFRATVRPRGRRRRRSRSSGPVQYRYEGNIFSGEKRMELLVVPRLSVTLTPDIAIVPANSVPAAAPPRAPAAGARRTRVARHRHQRRQGRGGRRRDARGAGRLDGDAGHARRVASRARTRPQPVRFTRRRPRAGAKPGRYTVKAVVTARRAIGSRAATR